LIVLDEFNVDADAALATGIIDFAEPAAVVTEPPRGKEDDIADVVLAEFRQRR
jgi:hypothetical protein